jgi:hypothetical protein
LGRLHRDGRGKTVVDIAADLGKPSSYVQMRLRLLKLTARGREVLGLGLLPLGGALILAQLDEASQEQALGDLFDLPEDAGAALDASKLRAVTIRDVREVIDLGERSLKKAPFAILDVELVPAAGACTTCPKRSGAQGALFDAGDDDSCIDAVCWSAKKKAHGERIAAEAKKAGNLLPAADSFKLFEKYGRSDDAEYHLKYSAGFERADGKPYLDSGKKSKLSYAELAAAAGKADAVVVAVAPDGGVHRLIPKKVAEKVMPKAPAKKASADETEAAAQYRQQREQQAAQEAEERQQALDLAAQVALQPFSPEQEYRAVLYLAASLLEDYVNADEVEAIAKAHEVKLPKSGELSDLVLADRYAGASMLAAALLIATTSFDESMQDRFLRLLGIDAAKARKKVQALADARATARKEKAKIDADAAKAAAKEKEKEKEPKAAPKGLGKKKPAPTSAAKSAEALERMEAISTEHALAGESRNLGPDLERRRGELVKDGDFMDDDGDVARIPRSTRAKPAKAKAKAKTGGAK